MEIFPGLHRIDVGLESRDLYCYLLRGRDVVLIDSGMPEDPQRVILPYMRSIGLAPKDLNGVISSHAHADHYFGNHAIKQAAPGAVVMGHSLDKAWLEDPSLYIPEEMQAFEEYGEATDLAEVEEFCALLTPPVKVDRCLQDGDYIEINQDWRLQVLHTPSHTPGHLAFYDAANRCLIASEAAAGWGMTDRSGEITNPPFYRDVAAQRATIARLQALDIECLLLAHDPVKCNGTVRQFLDDSVAFIDRAEEVYLDALRRRSQPLTMTELTDVAMRKLGPYASRGQVNWLTFSHMCDLEARGLASREAGTRAGAWSPG